MRLTKLKSGENATIEESRIIAENMVWVYWKEGNKIFRGKKLKKIVKKGNSPILNSKYIVNKIKEVEPRLFERMKGGW